ncbi:hypothetical protein PC111_g11054 [Phytophthora cactorum]|nr:hypothetical protein PC111_g11054 [Phytophthora cactorum]KAG2967112.1 hypothetical protein PC120_g27002 [Phytophthora cactorum]
MAGAKASELAVAVARGGDLGAIPCALLSPNAVREHVQHVRAATKHLSAPIHLNFFCHTLPPANPEADKQWQDVLDPYYQEYGVDIAPLTAKVKELKPEVVSFYSELPPAHLLKGVKDTGAFVISTATTVLETRWLEERGCDAIIAQGTEADETKTSALHRKRLKELHLVEMLLRLRSRTFSPVDLLEGLLRE